jgi:Ca2+-binding RTX toxin-like protein
MFRSHITSQMAAVCVTFSLAFAVIATMGTPDLATAAVKRCFGRNPTIVGTNGADHLVGTSGADVIAGLSGGDLIEGRGGGDYICGNAGEDELDGQGGQDSLNGGADADLLLGAGSSDVLAGGSGDDILAGEQGSDTYNGGSGIDIVGFLDSANPVRVDLREKFASGEGSDSVNYVEGVIGSEFSDVMFGNAFINIFEGLQGDDEMNGRGGSDFAFFTLAPEGMTVDLTLGETAGTEGVDSVLSIENVVGSPFDDSIVGTTGPNFLDGADGIDTIDGRGGGDSCFGEVVTGCVSGLGDTGPMSRAIERLARAVEARVTNR